MSVRITQTRHRMFGAACKQSREDLIDWLRRFRSAVPEQRPLESSNLGRMQAEAIRWLKELEEKT